MKREEIVDKLRLEQIYGYVYLLLYYKQVKKAIGQKKALKILSEAAAERRLSWYKLHQKEIAKDRDDFKTVLNYLDQITKELSPGQEIGRLKPRIIRKKDSLVLKAWLWCPIAEACKIVGLDPSEVCPALEQEAEMAVIEKLCPGIIYQLIRTRPYSLPHYQSCEFLIKRK
jgi:hypothetical protein